MFMLFLIRRNGSGVIVTYRLIFKKEYTLTELDTIGKQYLVDHSGRMGILGTATKVTFSGMKFEFLYCNNLEKTHKFSLLLQMCLSILAMKCNQ